MMCWKNVGLNSYILKKICKFAQAAVELWRTDMLEFGTIVEILVNHKWKVKKRRNVKKYAIQNYDQLSIRGNAEMHDFFFKFRIK